MHKTFIERFKPSPIESKEQLVDIFIDGKLVSESFLPVLKPSTVTLLTVPRKLLYLKSLYYRQWLDSAYKMDTPIDGSRVQSIGIFEYPIKKVKLTKDFVKSIGAILQKLLDGKCIRGEISNRKITEHQLYYVLRMRDGFAIDVNIDCGNCVHCQLYTAALSKQYENIMSVPNLII